MSNTSVKLAYPKYKVYIYGVEVTQDVISISPNGHDGEAPNQCTITLVNEFDRYILTSNDIIQLTKNISHRNAMNIPWLKDDPQSFVNTELDPDQDTTAVTADGPIYAGDISVDDSIKRQVLNNKKLQLQSQPPSGQYDTLVGRSMTDYYGGAATRYPLSDGAPIFHPMDPVRIFMRDPFNPGRWYYHFTGFVSDMSDSFDANNQKIFTIVAEDPTKLLRYTRVFVNPGIIDAQKIIQNNDLRVQSFYANYMKGFNLAEVFFMMIFGPDKTGAETYLNEVKKANGNNSNISTSLRGIGHFNFDTSGIFTFGPAPEKSEEPPAAVKASKPEIKQTTNDQVQPKFLLNIQEHIKNIKSNKLRKFLFDLNDNGLEVDGVPYAITITSSLRDGKTQHNNFMKGRELVNGKYVIVGPIVTRADSGQSYHEWGAAVDMMVYKYGDKNQLVYPSSDGVPSSALVDVAPYKAMSKKGSTYGLTWGGGWANFYDPVHFEDHNYTKEQYAQDLKDEATDSRVAAAVDTVEVEQPVYVDNNKPATNLLDVKSAFNLGNLQEWQSIIDHEVHPSDAISMIRPELRRSIYDTLIQQASNAYETGGIEAIIDIIGTAPQDYMVDGGRLLMLVPNSLGVKNNKIIVNDIIQSYGLNSEWLSAGSILYSTVDRIQFSMYCTPRGDIVVEPPLYDFDPDDFGMTQITQGQFIESMNNVANSTDTKIDDNINPVTILSYAEHDLMSYINKDHAIGNTVYNKILRGPYGQAYVIRKSDTTNIEAAFSDEKVYNVAVASHSIFQNYENLPNTSIIGDLVVIPIPNLIPLYGTRQVSLTPRGFISTAEAAKLFCYIQLAKLNADAHTIRVNIIPNIKLGVNRPLYIEARNCIATIKQVAHTITWGTTGSMETTVDLYATRVWEGLVDKNDPTVPIYTPIGGFNSRPLNYQVLFNGDKVQSLSEEDPSGSIKVKN